MTAMPATDDLTARTAVELSALLEAREVSAVEITEQVLARIEAIDPIVRAFVTVTADQALDDARASDRRRARGAVKGPLEGIPYSIKDLEATAGIRTMQGSKFFEHHVPDQDSAVAGILRRSGGVLLGKTNTPHMGYKDMCDNLVAPTTVNPWNTSTTPGGSSGGAAAAVAAGLGPVAQGGDGAGSIRIPAALTGTVGFKSTMGRVPLFPAADPWTSRVHNGPIARTVADAALLFAVLAQYDRRDPRSVNTPPAPFQPLEGARPLAGRRILFLPDFGYGTIANEVVANTRSAVAGLAELGAHIVESHAAPWFDPSGFHAVMYAGGGYPEPFEEHPDWVEHRFSLLLHAGDGRTVRDVTWAQAERARFFQQLVAVMDEYDYIVTPTMPLTAWSATPGPGPREIDGNPLDDALSRAFLVYPFNLSEQPAITIPSGFASDGLPTGVQIVGARFDDIGVLQVAAALERQLDLTIAWPTPDVRPEGIDAVVGVFNGG